MKEPDFWDYFAEVFGFLLVAGALTVWGYYIIMGEHEDFLKQEIQEVAKSRK